MADLLIRINGDIKNFKSKLEEAQKSTQDLDDALGKIAKVSGIAFAGLSAEIGFAVHAFAEAQAASRKLDTALQNQGIYAKDLVETYEKFAQVVQDKTGIDDDALVSAQATLQSFIGQREVTQELTQAMADLSTKTGDVDSAAQILGRGIEGNVKGLKQFGIVVDENLSKEERMKLILEQVTQKFGGQAAAANQGLGGIQGLTTAFGNLQEKIGERFAPVIEAAIEKITRFFIALRENEALFTLVASLLAGAAALAGLASGLSVLGIAFTAASAAAAAFGIAFNVATLGIGLAIAGIIAGITAIAMNWEKISKTINQYNPFVKQVEEQKKAAEESDAIAAEQDAKKKALADKQESDKQAAEQRRRDALRAHNELVAMEEAGASQTLIDLKKQEAELLDKIADDKNAAIRDKLRKHLEEVRQMRQNYGNFYVAIDEAVHSKEAQNFQKGTNELVALQNSKNATLKGIGKAAAIANIVIKTAESAMNIYSGFAAAIPIFGHALGVAGAAAAIAFGAEQVGNVVGAAQGGLLSGGIPGVDSIPVLAQQNELISPAQNFEEVIGSVRAAREAQNIRDQTGFGGGGGGVAEVVLSLKGGLVEFIEAQIVERQNLGISLMRA